ERTPDGLVGIPGAKIVLRREGTVRLIETISRFAKGKALGGYDVVLEAGRYRAAVSAPGFDTFVDPDAIDIVAGKATTRDFILKGYVPDLPRGRGIAGIIRARDRQGKPLALPDVKLSIVDSSSVGIAHATGTPDAKGAYKRDLLVGDYQVVATAD